ncbi:MAG: DUF3846 domain-containing protein [Oscillospiraceae bacterium]|nr:DUF3846 domain-containing protein [Oscillospiraceae bacterium]
MWDMLSEQRELIGEPKGENTIRVLVVEPNKAPYPLDVPNRLDTFQRLVDGLIEAVYFEEPGICGYCNDEGKLIGLEANRRFGGDIICGNLVILGSDDEGGNVSLTDEQIERYTEMFKEPEVISQDEVRSSLSYEIFTF